MREAVANLLRDVLTEFNAMYDQYNIGLDEQDRIYGGGSELDSIGLVALIVELGCRVDEELGYQIDLTNEKAFSQKNSPFATVGSLIDYIEALIEELQHV